MAVLTEMLETFPFSISGFHADNGSEYINHQVVKLLNKLHIELTKSRYLAQDIAMIMPWRKVKMHRLSVKSLVIVI